jgi:hypothetical protein
MPPKGEGERAEERSSSALGMCDSVSSDGSSTRAPSACHREVCSGRRLETRSLLTLLRGCEFPRPSKRARIGAVQSICFGAALRNGTGVCAHNLSSSAVYDAVVAFVVSRAPAWFTFTNVVVNKNFPAQKKHNEAARNRAGHLAYIIALGGFEGGRFSSFAGGAPRTRRTTAETRGRVSSSTRCAITRRPITAASDIRSSRSPPTSGELGRPPPP